MIAITLILFLSFCLACTLYQLNYSNPEQKKKKKQRPIPQPGEDTITYAGRMYTYTLELERYIEQLEEEDTTSRVYNNVEDMMNELL